MGTNVSHPVHRCLNLRLNLIGHIPINSSEPQEHKMTFAKANPSSVELKFCLMRLIPVGLSTNTYTCPYQGWPFQAVKQLELKLNRILCIFLFCTVLLIFYFSAECQTNPNYCKNGGACVSNEVTIWCTCRERFSGPKCEDQAGNL